MTIKADNVTLDIVTTNMRWYQCLPPPSILRVPLLGVIHPDAPAGRKAGGASAV